MTRFLQGWRLCCVFALTVLSFSLVGSSQGYELELHNGMRINNSPWHALEITNSNWAGIWVNHSGYDAFEVSDAGRHGLHIHSAAQHGVFIESTGQGNAIHIAGAAGSGLFLQGSGSHGLDVAAAGGVGVKVYSAGQDGVRVDSAAWSGLYVGSAGYDALRVGSAGQDGLRLFKEVGRDYIRAGSDSDVDFKVTKDGTAFADGGWQGAADFAELMITEGDSAGYEPGDVLVISPSMDRAVALSTTPYATSLIGVFSTKPGFVGSAHVMDGRQDQEIPVAIMGIVPCKVTDEGGAIRRGDLLTTSSLPGHAMKATQARIGAVLGKALGDLESGTGIIEILLTLQ